MQRINSSIFMNYKIITTSLLFIVSCMANDTKTSVVAEDKKTEQTKPKSEKPGQPLSPETEMAIMRVMNLENRIQTLQTVPVKMTENELASHFTGTWICFTTMRLNGQLGRGIMQINLKQEGDEITGDGGQLKHPFDPPVTIRPIGTWSSLTPFIGQSRSR